jgi:hypothetical protein
LPPYLRVRRHLGWSSFLAILPIGADRAVEDHSQEWRLRHPQDMPDPGDMDRYVDRLNTAADEASTARIRPDETDAGSDGGVSGR